jgi:hypothetical protein
MERKGGTASHLARGARASGERGSLAKHKGDTASRLVKGEGAPGERGSLAEREGDIASRLVKGEEVPRERGSLAKRKGGVAPTVLARSAPAQERGSRSEQKGATVAPRLTESESTLLRFLSDPEWYSWSVAYTRRKCGARSRQQLLNVAASLGPKINDQVNVFTFGGVEYIGLETRRLDYERDKLNGTNKVERMIQLGLYGTTR